MSMLTIHDLLKDPVYREFITKRPELPGPYTAERKPFRLFVLLKKDHKWHTQRYGTYNEAFAALKRFLPHALDATINLPAIQTKGLHKVVRLKGQYFERVDKKGKVTRIQKTKEIPWKPVMPIDEFEEHHWCPYCRRPTVFRRMLRHHALPTKKIAGVPIDPALMRCTICGASENIVDLRRK
jgi:hypothetical protein